MGELKVYKDKEELYYYSGIPLDCYSCKSSLISVFFYVRHFVSRKEAHFYCLCEKCLNQHGFKKIPELIKEVYPVIFTEEDIDIDFDNYKLVVFNNPFSYLYVSNRTNFDVADDFKSETHITDNTCISGQGTLQGAKIGKDVEEVIDNPDKVLSVEDGVKHLELLKSAVPIETFKLEDKDKDKPKLIEKS